MRAACGAHRAATHGRPVSLLARLADALATRRVATRHLAARANDVGTARTFRTPHGRAMGSPDSGDGRAASSLEGSAAPRSTVAARAASTGPASGERETHRPSPTNASSSSGMEQSHEEENDFKALKIPLDPALAVASMLKLEAEGWKFHQLRREVAETLDRASTNAPTFVATSLEILLERRASKARDANAADPLAHVLLECLAKSKAPRETVNRPQFDERVTIKHSRFTESRDRAVASKLIARSMRAYADTETETLTETALEPRALVRVAETYGVDVSDLHEACVVCDANRSDDGDLRTNAHKTDADELIHAYVSSLFASGAHGPAVHLTTHFLLRRFVSDAVLRQLVANHQFDLAFTLAERSSKATRVELIEICVATNEHAGYRAAWHAARDFRLEDEFPLVKQRYFESTIARMVEKGQSEAALRYAGDDTQLRHAVVQRLIEAGDAVTAAEYAGRIGLDVSSDGDGVLGAGALKTLDCFSAENIEAARRARRDAHLQLPDAVARAVTFVDDATGLAAAYEALKNEQVIGLDTEWAADLAVDAEDQALGFGTRARRAGKKRGRRRRRRRAPGADGEDDAVGSDAVGSDDASVDEADYITEEGTSKEKETETVKGRATDNASSVVALLQVASATNVFLLDFPALLSRCPDVIAPTLGALLSDDTVVKAGFGVAEDLRRLASLHKEAFGASKDGGPNAGVGPVVDLQHVWAAGTRAARADAVAGGRVGGRRSPPVSGVDDDESLNERLRGPWSKPEHYRRKHAVGLSAVSLAVLGKPLDKSTRMSDWSQRPLTERQVLYAALDAWVLVELLRVLRLDHAEELDRFAKEVTLKGE